MAGFMMACGSGSWLRWWTVFIGGVGLLAEVAEEAEQVAPADGHDDDHKQVEEAEADDAGDFPEADPGVHGQISEAGRFGKSSENTT